MAVTKYLFLISKILLLFTISDVLMDESSEEETCKVSQFMSGVCTVVSECGIALAALKRGRAHKLKRCGFTSGADALEIVCCPTTSVLIKSPETTTLQETDIRGATQRKSQKYCEEISTDEMGNVVFHIIGGENANENEFRHMASLGWKTDEGTEWNCGGTIISPQYILTAAHCFTKEEKPSVIRVGVTRLDDPKAVDYNIDRTIVHEDYNPSSKHNDIALVKISGKMKFNEAIQPACLYGEDDDPRGLIITGWGKTSIESEDDRSLILQKAFVEAVDMEQCNRTYTTRTLGTKTIDRTQLCAGTPAGSPVNTDSCWGDSGGPCQIQNKMGTYSIVSIISYGQQCGSKTPGVYTRVSAYLDWIEKIVWG